MALSQITWQDVQQLPDDGNRYEAIEASPVDPEANEVEVWTFADGPRAERFRDRLPVRLEGDTVGEIDLSAVFRES